MRKTALILLPTLILAIILLASWPGYLSFDSAFHWHQARHGEFGGAAPPLLTALWWLFIQCGLPSTSGPLLLTGGMYVFGFARFALNAEARDQPQLAIVLAVLGPACPLLVLLLPHVWTDVLMTAALLAASSLLNAPRFGRQAQLSVLVLLVLATSARHNGIFAVLPLTAWLVWRMWPEARLVQRGPILAGLLCLLVISKWLLTTALIEQRLDGWATAPMYDLQAVSVATGKQLLPTNMVKPGMDVEQLAAAYHPFNGSLLFNADVANPAMTPLTADQRSALLTAWLALPLEPAWWSHRWRLFRGLIGPHRATELAGLTDSPGFSARRDNPPLQRTFPVVHSWYRATASFVKRAWLGAAGLYLLLGLAGGVFLWRRSRQAFEPEPSDHSLLLTAFVLLTSAWTYTLPYFLLAPSADTRYLLWPALASWLVALLALCQVNSRSKTHN